MIMLMSLLLFETMKAKALVGQSKVCHLISHNNLHISSFSRFFSHKLSPDRLLILDHFPIEDERLRERDWLWWGLKL